MAPPVHDLVCHSCGAGLDDPQPNGDRVCRFCGQHARPDPDVAQGEPRKRYGIDFGAVFAEMDARDAREKKKGR